MYAPLSAEDLFHRSFAETETANMEGDRTPPHPLHIHIVKTLN